MSLACYFDKLIIVSPQSTQAWACSNLLCKTSEIQNTLSKYIHEKRFCTRQYPSISITSNTRNLKQIRTSYSTLGVSRTPTSCVQHGEHRWCQQMHEVRRKYATSKPQTQSMPCTASAPFVSSSSQTTPVGMTWPLSKTAAQQLSRSKGSQNSTKRDSHDFFYFSKLKCRWRCTPIAADMDAATAYFVVAYVSNTRGTAFSIVGVLVGKTVVVGNGKNLHFFLGPVPCIAINMCKNNEIIQIQSEWYIKYLADI